MKKLMTDNDLHDYCSISYLFDLQYESYKTLRKIYCYYYYYCYEQPTFVISPVAKPPL